MKTLAVPAANSNNSTIKIFNKEEEAQLEELNRNDIDLYQNKEEAFPHQSKINIPIDNQEFNDYNPYEDSLKPSSERISTQYPSIFNAHDNDNKIDNAKDDNAELNHTQQLQELPPSEEPQLLINPLQIQSQSQPQLQLDIKLSLYFYLLISCSPEKKLEKTDPLTKKKLVSFLVTTLPLKNQVRRHYSEFFNLREALTYNFPGIFIPPVPMKKMNQSTCTAEKMEKHMRHLEHFLTSIAQDSFLNSSKPFTDFISVQSSNSDLFKKSKTVNQKSNKVPIDLSSIYSRNGIEINKDKSRDQDNVESSVQFDEIKVQYKSTQAELVRLNKAFHLLFTEMRQVSDRLNEISTMFNTLSLIASSQGVTILSQSYLDLKKTMQDLSYNQRRSIVAFDHELKQFFKYLHRGYTGIKDLHDTYIKTKNDYIKGQEKLNAKKEELFIKGDATKWELTKEDTDAFDYKNKPVAFGKMLPIETEQVRMLQLVYYHFANSCIDEFNRISDVFGLETTKTHEFFISCMRDITI